MPAARPVTPDMLADRWGCSAETVRQMLVRGELHGFRVGRLWRIPAKAVEEYEWKSASDGSEADGAVTGQTPPLESDDAISLRLAPSRKRRQKP